MTSFLRTSRLTVLLLALALGAAACGVSRDGAASASSDGTGGSAAASSEPTIFGSDPGEVAASLSFSDGSTAEITRGQLNEAVSAVLDSEGFVQLAFGGAPPESIDSDVLTQMIGDKVIEQAFTVAGGTIDDDARDAAETQVIADLASGFETTGDADAENSASTAADELGAYFSLMVNIRAGIDGLGALLATVEYPCVSHILVATEGEAQDLYDQLADGADFATLAQANSTDPGSAANGGELGCQQPDSWVPEFRDAMLEAKVGEVTEPVESDFGFHLILVTGSEANGQEAAQTALQSELAGATIDVDESIGVWTDGRVLPNP